MAPLGSQQHAATTTTAIRRVIPSEIFKPSQFPASKRVRQLLAHRAARLLKTGRRILTSDGAPCASLDFREVIGGGEGTLVSMYGAECSVSVISSAASVSRLLRGSKLCAPTGGLSRQRSPAPCSAGDPATLLHGVDDAPHRGNTIKWASVPCQTMAPAKVDLILIKPDPDNRHDIAIAACLRLQSLFVNLALFGDVAQGAELHSVRRNRTALQAAQTSCVESARSPLLAPALHTRVALANNSRRRPTTLMSCSSLVA